MDSCIQISSHSVAEWHTDLQELGYKDPLPAPSPAVQATLAALDAPAIHQFILEKDLAALHDVDDEGEHAPLFLSTLDLSQWTRILAVAIKDKDKALDDLKTAHAQLASILEYEAEELELALTNTRLVDAALKQANPHEGLKSGSSLFAASSQESHPLFAGLKIAPADRAVLEDLASSIQLSQSEKDAAQLHASGRGPTVPFTPNRSVEDQVALKNHRCWGLPNINLLAPITVHMWRTWADISLEEMKTLESNAIHGTGLLREAQDIPNGFSLSLCDRQKCQTPDVKIHTKQNLQTGHMRIDKYSAALWNCQRPYLRCLCNFSAASGCRGDVMWFDHSVWYMVNHLDLFFPTDQGFPTLASKFGAFIVWISDAARVAVRHQITFTYLRKLMVEAAIQYVSDPTAKLLPAYKDAAGVRQIERLLKPASFTVANPGTPSPGPSGKRTWSKMNLNLTPDSNPTPHRSNPRYGRGGHMSRGSSRGGRGGYNRNYRPQGQQANPNEAFVFITPTRRGANDSRNGAHGNHTPETSLAPMSSAPSPSISNQSVRSPGSVGNSVTSSRATPRFDQKTMKARILDWDDMDI